MKGAGERAAGARDVTRARCAPARRAGRAGRAGQASSPDGEGATRPSRRCAPRWRCGPRIPSWKRYLDRLAAGEHGDVGVARRARASLRRGHGYAMLRRPAQATDDPTGQRRGRAAGQARRARSPERLVAHLRPARRPGADGAGRRGEQGVRGSLHAGTRRGRHPAGARLPAQRARRPDDAGGDQLQQQGCCSSRGTGSITTTAPRWSASRGCALATSSGSSTWSTTSAATTRWRTTSATCSSSARRSRSVAGTTR